MKILTLSTYPFGTPRHGGQHRLRSIVDSYRAAGHQVRSIGVLGSPTYPNEEGFVAMPTGADLARYISNPLLMEDWAIGQLAVNDDAFFSALCSRILEEPDVVHVEQPWLFGFAQRYVAGFARKAPMLVYGSENIEHLLKQRIVEGYLGRRHSEECGQLVLKCEVGAAEQADLVCAVSAGDAEWLRLHASSQVVVAANGVRDRPSTPDGIAEANRITGHHKNALYCASAHPPNLFGFFDMFERGVGCLSPDERLVVAGSAGPSLRLVAKFPRVPGLASRYLDAGEVSEDCIQGLLTICHTVVLPITQGGGTNLKTAEALWAGRHVVATPVAMRGFERFENSPGVAVCEDAIAFRQAIRAAMAAQPMELTEDERLERRSLLWESTLLPLVNRVADLEYGPI
jgi:glycosyltransferase involved in cell wall biosynthesis